MITSVQCLCQAVNWYDMGDINDITGVDIEAIKCWNCKKHFFVDEHAEESCNGDLGEAYEDQGHPSPNQAARWTANKKLMSAEIDRLIKEIEDRCPHKRTTISGLGGKVCLDCGKRDFYKGEI